MEQDGWSWWFSTDGGERYAGPYESRAAAIEAGHENTNDVFYICEARKGKLRSFVLHDLAERFDEANEDNGDPEGPALSEKITASQWKNLEDRFDAAAREWIDAHNLHKHVFMFEEARNYENIAAANPDEDIPQ